MGENFLAFEQEKDKNGEMISRVLWSKNNKYKWKKENVGEKSFFKIKDPVSKKILTYITDEEFKLEGKF